MNTDYLISISYGLIVLCYVPQWAKVLRTKSVGDLSPLFMLTAIAGLVGLQVGFWQAGAPRPVLIGNATALFNALILMGSYLYVRLQCAK